MRTGYERRTGGRAACTQAMNVEQEGGLRVQRL